MYAALSLQQRIVKPTTAPASLPPPALTAALANRRAAVPSSRPEARRESSKAASFGLEKPVADFAKPATAFAERNLFHKMKLESLRNRAVLEAGD